MMKSLNSNLNIFQITGYYPPHLGGMENCVYNISKLLCQDGYNVTVLTSDQGYKETRELASKISVKYLKSIEIAHTPIIFSLFFKLLLIPKNSIIHLHISQALIPEIVYIVAKFRGIPYICHFHLDVDGSGFFGFLLKPYKRLFLKKVLQSSNKIICLSTSQKQLIINKYSLKEDQIAIVPNGVSSKFFINHKHGANKIKRLLFVGRIAPQKNLSLLIESANLLKSKIIIDIIGEGEDKQKILKLVKKYKLRNVYLHGRKSEDQLIKYYQNSDAFINPALKEGLSLAMLEAMATGLPIIASNVSGIKELIKNCGIIIDNPSVKNYAKSIDLLLSDSLKLKLLSINAQKKATQFTWNKATQKIEKLYSAIL